MTNTFTCPYCNKQMELGYIHGDRYALKWIPKDKDKGTLLQWFSKGIKLTKPLTNSSIESFYCNNCDKIIIDTENILKEQL